MGGFCAEYEEARGVYRIHDGFVAPAPKRVVRIDEKIAADVVHLPGQIEQVSNLTQAPGDSQGEADIRLLEQ